MGLPALLRERREPIAADLIRFYGIPLSQVRERVTLWEFVAMVVHLPRESATWAAEHPDAAAWGLSEQLLAEVADSLHWLQWAKTADGSKGRNRPKPIPRPGIKSDEREERRIGSDPIPLDELADWLAWSREVADVPTPDDE